MRKKGKHTTRKEKKRLLLITIIFLLLVGYFGYKVYDNFMKISINKNEIITLNNEYEDLLDQNKELTSEVAKMKDPEYVARYAKEKYLYSSDGEVILRVDGESDEKWKILV